jgi:hypothetical protein
MAESTIAHRQRELFGLYTAIMGPRHNPAPLQNTAPTAPSVALSDDDSELLAIGVQRHGPAFGRLIRGDRSDYANPSDADSGIIKDVLRLTGGDAERTERILRNLPLRREKWDSRRGAKTWLRYSIDRTIGRGYDTPDPSTWPKLEPAAPDGNGHHALGSCPSCCACCSRHLQVIESQQQVITAQRAELEQLRGVQAANSERLGDLKRFRQTATFSGKRKDVVEAIAFEVERARRRGLTEVPIYYGDRQKRKHSEDPGGLAGAAGTSPHTVEGTVDLLRGAGTAPWRFERYLDDNGFRRVKVLFDPTSTVERDLAQLAELPKAETIRREPPRCRDCPTARLYVVKTCKNCGQVVAEYTETPPKGLVAGFYKGPAHSAAGVDPVSRLQESPARHADVGFAPLEGEELPPLFWELMAMGGRAGFPPIVVAGKVLRGREQWEILATPEMLGYVPEAFRGAEGLERE